MGPSLEQLSLKNFRGQLKQPNFKKSICGVMPTAFELLDLPIPIEASQNSFFLISEGKQSIKQNITDFTDTPRHIINILIDSWGVDHLTSSSNLAKLVTELQGFLISSVFPTITSSAVTSWHLGVPPSTHGILGHKILIQEVGAVVDTLKMQIVTGYGGRDSLIRTGVHPESWLWSSPLYNELDKYNVLHFELVPQSFAGTGLSHFFLSKTNSIVIGCDGLVDLFATARDLLIRNNHKNKLLINIYLSSFDWLAHKFHPQSEESAAYLNQVGDTLKWLLCSTPDNLLKETVITLSADHGHIDVTQMDPVLFLKSQQEYMINNLLRAIPGRSGRMAHFYVKYGKADQLKSYLEDIIGNKGLVISTDQSTSLLNVNTISEPIKSRIGDILVLLVSGTQFEYESTQKESQTSTSDENYLVDYNMKGSHGSLTFNELAVPYIASLGTQMKNVLLSQ